MEKKLEVGDTVFFNTGAGSGEAERVGKGIL